MFGKDEENAVPSSVGPARAIHVRMDAPEHGKQPRHVTQLWSLQEELDREISSRLSVISSCLGVFALLSERRNEVAGTEAVQTAITTASEQLSRAGQIIQSARRLHRVQAEGEVSRSVNQCLDDAVTILRPKLHNHGIDVCMKRHQTARVVCDLPRFTESLVTLIDTLTNESSLQSRQDLVLLITTSVHRGQAEVLLCLDVPGADTEHPLSGAEGDGEPPSHDGNRRHGLEGVAQSVSRQLGCSVRFGKRRAGGEAYSILFETSPSLQR